MTMGARCATAAAAVRRDAVGQRLHFFFFFQAEDGIRDSSVTGVQTCALPILQTVASPAPLRLRVETELGEPGEGGTPACLRVQLLKRRGPALERPLKLPLQHVLPGPVVQRSEEHTSELQSHLNLVCRLLLEKKTLLHACIALLSSTTMQLDRHGSFGSSVVATRAISDWLMHMFKNNIRSIYCTCARYGVKST